MTHREIINKTFNQYFHSNYLPTAYGGFPGSTTVQLLSAISLVHEKIESQTDIDKVWYNDQTVTWYTPQLHKLVNLPRFPDDSDQDFLNRLMSFQEAQEFGGQSENSIRVVLLELMKEAILNSNIAFLFTQDFADQWDGSEFWDGTATWQDLETALDVDFLVFITFPRVGYDIDKFTWEYWNLEANMTKIDELILLFKPVGATFKIELQRPKGSQFYIGSPQWPLERAAWPDVWRGDKYKTSNSRLKKLANEFTKSSSTAMKVFAYADKAKLSQTALFTAGYFYGDLESYQTINLTSILNVEVGGNQGDVTKRIHTRLYGSRTAIAAP